MNYPETVAYLYSTLPMFQRIGAAAYKKDLGNIRVLCEHLGHPEQAFKSVHIAGTNGKGSTSHMLASVLQESGYNTGLFTSPHLKSFTERIRVNGKEATENFIVDFVARHRLLMEEIQPSFFEITVAMAFQYFAEMHTDIAVLETGMGGRLDSTNIVIPELSVITNIGLDHTQFLGDTRSAIAVEKAGIIKQGIPVVVGENDTATAPAFEEKARHESAPLIYTEDVTTVLKNAQDGPPYFFHHLDISSSVTHEIYHVECPLGGNYQPANIRTVIAAAEMLSRHNFPLITRNTIENGIRQVKKHTGLRGRWEILQEAPLVIADVGHNSHGLKIVMEQLQQIPAHTLHIVIGFVNDKSLDDVLELLPGNARYYITAAEIPRALDAETLGLQMQAKGFRVTVIPHSTDAYAAALASAGEDDVVYIGGSTFVVAEIL